MRVMEVSWVYNAGNVGKLGNTTSELANAGKLGNTDIAGKLGTNR